MIVSFFYMLVYLIIIIKEDELLHTKNISNINTF